MATSDHIPVFILQPITALAKSLGVPVDQLMLLLCLLASLPLGTLHKSIPTTALKHIYTLTLGLLYLYLVIGTEAAIQLLLYSIVFYVLVSVLTQVKTLRRQVGLLLSCINLVYLSVLHIHRMYTDYMGWSIDISLAAMILVVKLNMTAYNLADGALIEAGEQLSDKEVIQQYRVAKSVQHLNLLEFLGYCFYYPAVLTGPPTEIRQYLDYSDGSVFKRAGLKSIPSSFKWCALSVRNAVLCYIGMIISSNFPILGVLETDSFLSKPFWWRWLYFWIAATSSRFKYYFSWYLSEAGCQATGMAFEMVEEGEGEKKKQVISFAACNNVQVLSVELSTHLYLITSYWNRQVNTWLKHYVYFRVSPPRSITRIIPAKSAANIVTKLMSACWHGFYGAYYLFFLGAWLVNEMDDALRFTVEPRVKATKNKVLIRLYNLFQWVIVYVNLNYLGAAFMLLRADYSLKFWSSFYYYGFWLPILIIALCQFLPKRRDAKKTAAPTKSHTQNNGQLKREISTSETVNEMGYVNKKDL